MDAILEGLRVVEFSRLIAAPLCGLTLRDWGADVVKVEPPEGDYTRTLPPKAPSGESGYFQMLNRGKRAVVLDLHAPGAHDVARALVLGADVVVESLGDAAPSLGIGFADAHRYNPKLIWCSITGTGRGHAGRAIDPSLQASMGMMALTGEAAGAPMRLPVPLVDFMTAMYAVQSILAALLAVERGGPGALLDCAMVDAAATLTSSVGVYAMNGPAPLRRMGTENLWYVPAANFEAADGEYVQLMAISEHHWRGLARALGRPEWIDDPRFADNDARVQHRRELHDLIARVIRTAPAAHWSAEITAAGGFCERIREIEEAWSDPLLEQRGLLTSVALDAPEEFRVPVVSLARTSRAPTTLRAPRLGEHSLEIAAELGLDSSTAFRTTIRPFESGEV